MNHDDPLGEEMVAARRRQEEASRAHEAWVAQAEQRQAAKDAADEQKRRELKTLGRSFIERARAAGIRPSRVQVGVGVRDRYEGFFRKRKVGTESVYESHVVWTVLAYHSGSGYSSDPPHPGIYVLADGQIIGSMANINTFPYGRDLAETTRAIADYLVNEGA